MKMNPRLSCVAAGMVAALPSQGCVELKPLGNSAEQPPAGVLVQVDPPPDDPLELAPIVQFHLGSEDPASEVQEAVVARGELSSHDLEALAAGQPSPSLKRRLVDSVSWRGRDGELVIAPKTAFEAAEAVSVGVPSRGWSRAWTVADDALPRLTRVWPVAAEGAWAGHAVWCEAQPSTGWTPSTTTQMWLGPDLSPGRLGAGMMEGFGPGCVYWDPAGGPIPSMIVPPPRVELEDGRAARIEPEPISGLVTAAGEPVGECGAGRTPIGAGCAEVHDDRVVLFGQSTPALIAVEIGGKRICGIPTQDMPMVIRGLVPNQRNEGMVTFIDGAGRRYEGGFAVRTGAPEPHVVINEVMANPAGPEPDQEWVELYNDGASAVELGGWQLEDTGLGAELPPWELAPGGFALVVNDAYQEGGWGDRAPVPGTPLLRVPQLGKGGLSNTGEPLRLLRLDGFVASMVPAIPSPRQSESVARIAPDASDKPSSFQPGRDGGTPGAWNTTTP